MGEGWSRGWTLDARSLAVFRVALGVLLLADLIGRAGDLGALYTDAGVMPRAVVPEGSFGSAALSVYRVAGSWGWVATLFVVQGLLALGVVVGFGSRACCAGAWVLWVGLQGRNPWVCYEADVLLAGLVGWAALLPVGARWSWDVWGRASTCGAARSWASAGLVSWVAGMYWFAFVAKSGPMWWRGEAVQVALQLDLYATEWGRSWLAWPGVLRWLTWGTLAVEALAPFALLWPRWRVRCAAVCALAGLQLGFWLSMDLGLFPWVSAVALLPLVPGEVWGRGGEGVRRGAWWEQGVAGVALVVSLGWVSTGGAGWPGWAARCVRALHWDLSWSMFAPEPTRDDGWLVWVGVTEAGGRVDLVWGGAPRLAKPTVEERRRLSDRWQEYQRVLYERGEAEDWLRCAEWWVERWEARVGERVRRVEVVYVRERSGGWSGEEEPEPTYVRVLQLGP